MRSRWQVRVNRVVVEIIAAGNLRFGRAYATFLADCVQRLDDRFGPSRSRGFSDVRLKRNRYKIAASVLQSLGYAQRDIAEILNISQAAVSRLLVPTECRNARSGYEYLEVLPNVFEKCD